MKLKRQILSRINNLPGIFLTFAIILSGVGYAFGASNSNFSQTINPGSLSVDIVDDTYASVSSPQVAMADATFSFACQTTTGTFGTSTERIYVKNPDAADSGWTLSIAGSAPTAVWTGGAGSFDFNDASGSGCTDGADTDNYGGQMTINPAAGTLATGACASCTVSNITKGSSNAFVEGTTNSITLLTAAADSSDIGDWLFTGVGISQKVPAEQPAGSNYVVNLTMSIVAN